MKSDPVIIMSFVCLALSLINFAKTSNLLIMIISIELMLNSLNIVLARIIYKTSSIDAAFWILIIISIAAAEVGIGLALIVMISKKVKTVDCQQIKNIKEIFK